MRRLYKKRSISYVYDFNEIIAKSKVMRVLLSRRLRRPLKIDESGMTEDATDSFRGIEGTKESRGEGFDGVVEYGPWCLWGP